MVYFGEAVKFCQAYLKLSAPCVQMACDYCLSPTILANLACNMSRNLHRWGSMSNLTRLFLLRTPLLNTFSKFCLVLKLL